MKIQTTKGQSVMIEAEELTYQGSVFNKTGRTDERYKRQNL